MAKSAFAPVLVRISLVLILLLSLFSLITILGGHFVTSTTIGFISAPKNQYIIDLMDTNHGLRTKVGHTPNVNVFIRSPDGQHIAFVVSHTVSGNIEAVPPVEVQFYIMTMTGSDLRELIGFPGQMTAAPSWSPDGSQIAFSANRYGQSDIYLLNVQTGAEHLASKNPGDNYGAVWSPDGTQLAFVSKNSGQSTINILDITSDKPAKIVAGDSNGEPPVWSPDGTQLAFVTYALDAAEIVIVNRDGSNVRQLTNNTVQDYAPVWSPDGQHIAYQSLENGAQYQISIMNPDGSQPRRLVDSTGSILEAVVWSPDSRQIAYAVDRDQNLTTKIVTVNSDGSGERLLTPDHFSSRLPVWWPP